jgi:hypothetical protein
MDPAREERIFGRERAGRARTTVREGLGEVGAVERLDGGGGK